MVLCLVVAISSSFMDSTTVVADPRPGSQEVIDFNTDGLYYAEFYDYIFRGHFEEVDMPAGEMEFLMIFDQYLRAYGAQCPSALPSNKVEIMNQVCATEEVTKNAFGDVISRVCVEYVWVGSGLYARPDLYQAKMELENVQRSKAVGTVFRMVMDPNSMGNSVDMIHRTNGLKNDMARIFKLNDCQGRGIRRFEENLKLFAQGRPGIRMQQKSKYTVMKESGGPTGPQNFTKLVDDLVADQAKTWGFNRYVAGSVSGVSLASRDGQGRPVELSAGYTYTGFGGNSKGSVRITFENGLPKCIYFFDFPQNCKAPNSAILSSYAQGAYAE